MAKQKAVETLGEVVAKARKAKGLSQKDLAALTGYGESGVSIARIETGVILRPSDAKLVSLAKALDLDVEELRKLAVKPSKHGPLAGPKLRRANRDRVEALNRQMAEFKLEVESRYEPLEKLRRQVETDFLKRLFELIDGIEDLPVADSTDLDKGGASSSGSADARVRLLVDEYRAGVSGMLAKSLSGAGVGGAVGAGAAFATYSAVAAYATASTGTAIATLSGVAATNATMAALGGGSLAAGGLGVTGGAVVLGSIIAFPAAAIGGLVFYGAGKKLARQEEDVSAQIKEAEDDFDARARCIRESFEWVTKAQAFLTLVLHRVANRLRTLDEIPLLRLGESDRPVAWAELSEDAQSILRELLDLAAVTISVLPLPVIATPDAGEPASKVEALERESREWNNAVLDLAMAWFAS